MSNADGPMMPWSKISVNNAVLTVWPGAAVKQNDLPIVMAFFKSEFGIEPTPVGCVKTLPDIDEKGNKIEGTGAGERHDFFFFVKYSDVWKFAGPRFAFGMRWWQDIYVNNQENKENIYPLEFCRTYPSENWSSTGRGDVYCSVELLGAILCSGCAPSGWPHHVYSRSGHSLSLL